MRRTSTPTPLLKKKKNNETSAGVKFDQTWRLVANGLFRILGTEAANDRACARRLPMSSAAPNGLQRKTATLIKTRLFRRVPNGEKKN